MLPMLMINLGKDLKQLVDREMRDAYIHGFKSAAQEDGVKVLEKQDKYSHINFKPTAAMAKEAAKGLEYRREFGRGGTEVGVARARDIKNRVNLSPKTCKRMKAFFDRHQVDRQGENWGNEHDPSAGYIAHLLWGGDAGYSWAKARVRQINAVDDKKSLSYGSKKEETTNLVYKADTLDIDFDQADEDAIRALQSGKAQTNAYNELSVVLSTKLNAEITNAIVEGRSIPNTVAEMQKVINTETYKLTRIARTEIINVTNEGRLASYQKQEQKRKKPFKYTLVVASGARTCDAHKELDRRIPAEGLLMNELIELQAEIAPKYKMRLSGNSLLHPNQRTVLMRVP
jgi:hypothetical protein